MARVVNKLRGRQDRQMLTMCILPLLKVFLFAYLPLLGLILAFENFKPQSFILSPWVGFENFRLIFQDSEKLLSMIWNAISFNLLFLVTNTLVTVFLALFMYEMTSRIAIRTVQTFVFFPFFVAWTVVGQIVLSLVGMNGAVTAMLAKLNGGNFIDFYSSPQYWRFFFVLIYIWKNAGVGAVTNYCVLLGADRGVYEAADIDGANRFQKMWYISLSHMSMMIVIGLITSLGNIIRIDFSMIFFIVGTNAALYPVVDVIETYMYRAMMSAGTYGQTVAIGLFQSVVGLLLTLGANTIARRVDKTVALF